jgi:hypothetical protein
MIRVGHGQGIIYRMITRRPDEKLLPLAADNAAEYTTSRRRTRKQ